MEKLRKYTEEYISIRARYDAGTKYKWDQVLRDLEKLERNIAQEKSRSDWVRTLMRLLYKEVHEEAIRVWKITLCKK